MAWRSSSPICRHVTADARSIVADDISEPSGLLMGVRAEDEWFSAANGTAAQQDGEKDRALCLGAKGRRRIMVNPRLVSKWCVEVLLK